MSSFGALVCAYRGYHEMIRHGAGSSTANVLYGPAYCMTCGVGEEARVTDDQKQQQPTGWVCPKCQRAVSPNVTVCPCTAKQESDSNRRLLFG